MWPPRRMAGAPTCMPGAGQALLVKDIVSQGEHVSFLLKNGVWLND